MRIVVIAFALALTGCTPKHDAEDAGLKFMMLMKTASGGPALNAPNGFHEAGALTVGGETRTYETWGDFHALRMVSITTRADGLSMTNGFDGNAGWQIGPDGVVERITAPDAVAALRLGTYITVSGYFYPDRFPASFEYKGRQEAGGIAYDVVTMTPEGAPPMDAWLDIESHLLQRLTGRDGDLSFEGDVKTYNVVDGVSVPWEMEQTVGGQSLQHKVLTLEFTDVPPEKFAPPEQP